LDWERYGHVIASSYRTRIVLLLLKGPKTPKKLAVDSGLYLSHVSTTLKDLLQKEIVVCLTPKLRRGKIFDLTEIGKIIASSIIKDS